MVFLRLSLRPWRASFGGQAMMALSLGILFFVISMLIWVEQGVRPVIRKLSGEQTLTAYLAQNIQEKEAEAVVDQIQIRLGSQVNRIELIGRKAFLDKLSRHYPELKGELENLGTDLESVVPQYVSISGFFSGNVRNEVGAISGVEEVESSSERIQAVIEAFSSVQWLVRVLGAGLAIVMILFFQQIVRMNARLHQDSLNVLRFWGAGEWELRIPGALSGGIVGLAGGVLAGIAWALLPHWLVQKLHLLAPALAFISTPPLALALIFPVFGLLLGMLMGVFSSASGRINQVTQT